MGRAPSPFVLHALETRTTDIRARRNGKPRIYAHNRKGVGLNLLGEVQLPGCEPDDNFAWFDGVPGLIQWGGAATTFYKYQVVNGRPLLLIMFTQVLPQDWCVCLIQGPRVGFQAWRQSKKLAFRGRPGLLGLSQASGPWRGVGP